jgi:hypothetical protein
LWPFEIFYNNSVCFMAIRYFCSHLVNFPPFWYVFTKKNLATLVQGVLLSFSAFKRWLFFGSD